MPQPATRPLWTVLAAAFALVAVTACEAQHVAAPPVLPVAPPADVVASTLPPLPPATSIPAPLERSVSADVSYPENGSAEWRFAAGDGPVAGQNGKLARYRLAVETDIGGVDPGEFADAVEAILDDPRGWTAGGEWRLQRVGPASGFDFTIMLATPGTRDHLCGGTPDSYTSCRNGNSVVLNVARWSHAVPGYSASLAVYRQYMVTHEVGHRLGQGHQLCPGPGRMAPVMQQQTLGLHGCVPNPWPYPDGRLYAGASGEYDDPIPAGAS
ncbi:MAG TPA: DUF3152 domain-containing protein [Amycolatopsis sp.]|nr:DUF3152 domain-containing protein [Amycolatopsis sp.]